MKKLKMIFNIESYHIIAICQRFLGCRFIEERPSNSSRRFVPLIDLSKNGTLYLKVFLNDVRRCNEYQLYFKRPKLNKWIGLGKKANIFTTVWAEWSEKFLNLQVKCEVVLIRRWHQIQQDECRKNELRQVDKKFVSFKFKKHWINNRWSLLEQQLKVCRTVQNKHWSSLNFLFVL
jgi:hypothetical protein